MLAEVSVHLLRRTLPRAANLPFRLDWPKNWTLRKRNPFTQRDKRHSLAIQYSTARMCDSVLFYYSRRVRLFPFNRTLACLHERYTDLMVC